MAEIAGVLEAILGHLSAMNRPVVSLLQSGIDRAAIQSRLSWMSLSSLEALESLYGWRSGTRINPGDSLDDVHFFPGFYFLSIEDALSTYTAFRSDSRWSADWFPLFANGGGDFYALNLHRGKYREGEIIGFLLGEAEHRVEYLSLNHMMRTVLECFESGVFFHKDGYLEANDAEQARIARRLNPGLAAWERQMDNASGG